MKNETWPTENELFEKELKKRAQITSEIVTLTAFADLALRYMDDNSVELASGKIKELIGKL